MEIFFALLLTFLTLLAHPTLRPSLASVSSAKIPPISIPSDSLDPWGKAIPIGDHTYHIRINNDTSMGSADEILLALNQFRLRNGVQPLTPDLKLCTYAQSRAVYFTQIKATDAHKGFIDYLDNHDGFSQLGYGQLGENSSYGYVMSGVHLIEFIYQSSAEHNRNQLNPKWDHGCVGVSDSASDLIFATSPL